MVAYYKSDLKGNKMNYEELSQYNYDEKPRDWLLWATKDKYVAVPQEEEVLSVIEYFGEKHPRWANRRLRTASPIADGKVLVLFSDGSIDTFDVESMIPLTEDESFKKYEELLCSMV